MMSDCLMKKKYMRDSNGKTNRYPSYCRTNMYLEKFILNTKITNIFHKYANFVQNFGLESD